MVVVNVTRRGSSQKVLNWLMLIFPPLQCDHDSLPTQKKTHTHIPNVLPGSLWLCQCYANITSLITQLPLCKEKNEQTVPKCKESRVFTSDSDIFVCSPQTSKTLNNASGQSGCSATSLQNREQITHIDRLKNHSETIKLQSSRQGKVAQTSDVVSSF